ncbi:MAG: nitroreductase family protein [Planctomycetota bacterium]
MAAAVRDRRTLKVLADVDDPPAIAEAVSARHREAILEDLRTAGWAPFHYDRGADGLAEPWRAHVLQHDESRRLASDLFTLFPDLRPDAKLPAMMAACGALVLVTWLPQFRRRAGEDGPAPNEKQIAVDDEHLAAASAMVQNFLLLQTARGMGTYWSSGGQLGSPAVFDRLGISSKERLLAAVFVEFPETQRQPRDRLPGKLRERRSAGWIRERPAA